MNKSQLLNNRGNVDDVKIAVKACNSRSELRLALSDELSKDKPRKTVVELLEKKLKA